MHLGRLHSLAALAEERVLSGDEKFQLSMLSRAEASIVARLQSHRRWTSRCLVPHLLRHQPPPSSRPRPSPLQSIDVPTLAI